MILEEELQKLLTIVIDKVGRWTERSMWCPQAGSQAAAELANAEVGLDGPWGTAPVNTAFALAGADMNCVLELARSFNLVLDQKRTSISLEILARTALEASGCAWWLLDLDIIARQRVCRLQLLRISGAVNLAKSIASSGADPIEVGGESPEFVCEYSRRLGIKDFEKHDGKKNRKCESEELPSYTERVAALTNAASFHGSYEIYSGTAHAEVFGIFRIYGPFASTYPERQTVLMLARKPRAVLAASQAMLVALIQPMSRAAKLFGWGSETIVREVDELIELANDTVVYLDAFCKSLPESESLV